MHIFICVIERNAVILLPQMDRILSNLGENIKLARLRRRLSAEIVAERAGISRATLTKVEKGSSSVAMGIYASVLFALGLEKDLMKVASDDVLGRKLQDLDLIVHKRAPKRIKEIETISKCTLPLTNAKNQIYL